MNNFNLGFFLDILLKYFTTFVIYLSFTKSFFDIFQISLEKLESESSSKKNCDSQSHMTNNEYFKNKHCFRNDFQNLKISIDSRDCLCYLKNIKLSL